MRNNDEHSLMIFFPTIMHIENQMLGLIITSAGKKNSTTECTDTADEREQNGANTLNYLF